MLASIYVKLIGAGIILAIMAGLFLWGHHVGSASVQAKWDDQTLADKVAVATAEQQNSLREESLHDSYNSLSARYMEIVNAPTPSLANAIPASLSAGTLVLRDNPVCPSSGNVTTATARSRAADAATTQALADRVSNAIAAVRLGDQTDARERQLDAQIVALQGVLSAERKP